MCGILGFVEFDAGGAEQSALDALNSRGPDGRELMEVAPGVRFGHARLAVIDVEGGRQPMTSADGRYTVVYNGEIYNFRELRDELAAGGSSFLTHSDTEVLLNGYGRWGTALPQRLDGMFAFALWDRREKTLFCARDRIGVKPFFYAAGPAVGRGLVFASTLAPFMALPTLPRPIDYEALRDYLAMQTVSAPRSLVKTVRQLPPAHWLLWRKQAEPVIEAYWSIPGPNRAGAATRTEFIEAADAALAESVRRQLIADVPIGAFLSGGIDSSLVVHYMSAAGAKPVRTFSVRFAAASVDESAVALDVARQYGSEHTVFDAEDLSGDAWRTLIDTQDQPLADPAFVPLAALSRLTRQSVTVALSGDGGDELFGGYARFFDTEGRHPAKCWQPWLAALIRRGLAPPALTRRALSGRALIDYQKVELGPYPGTRKDFAAYLRPEALAATRPDRVLDQWHALLEQFGGQADTDAMMRADLWTYLSDNCLMKTDRAAMAFGLEGRVPLLGNPVLDLVLPQPASIHFDHAPKAVLRALAQRYLPRSVWDRPKQGFTVPLDRYFHGAWKAVGDELVSRSRELAPWLREEAIRSLWGQARHRGSRRLMYTFLVLLAWLDRHHRNITI
ncbi:MAG: asparagine synthase (glutamine-hydrolyzing) [Nitrospirota bacterium]